MAPKKKSHVVIVKSDAQKKTASKTKAKAKNDKETSKAKSDTVPIEQLSPSKVDKYTEQWVKLGFVKEKDGGTGTSESSNAKSLPAELPAIANDTDAKHSNTSEDPIVDC